jgi:hypothetical protein
VGVFPPKVMTLEVLNNGTDCSDEQPLNIPPFNEFKAITVTLAVSNNGTLINELHPLNITDISVTLIVLNNGTD